MNARFVAGSISSYYHDANEVNEHSHVFFSPRCPLVILMGILCDIRLTYS